LQSDKDSEFEYESHLFCIDDPKKSLALHGPSLWDDLDKGRNVSHMYVKVQKCKNSTTTETTCSTPEEIDNWLEGK